MTRNDIDEKDVLNRNSENEKWKCKYKIYEPGGICAESSKMKSALYKIPIWLM